MELHVDIFQNVWVYCMSDIWVRRENRTLPTDSNKMVNQFCLERIKLLTSNAVQHMMRDSPSRAEKHVFFRTQFAHRKEAKRRSSHEIVGREQVDLKEIKRELGNKVVDKQNAESLVKIRQTIKRFNPPVRC